MITGARKEEQVRQYYCQHKPFDMNPQKQGGGSAQGSATPIDGSSMDITMGAGVTPPMEDGHGAAAMQQMQGMGTQTEQPNVVAPGSPSATDNFLKLASNPKGTLSDSFMKGWRDGVNINTAEKGGKLGLLDTLGAGVSGGVGGMGRTVSGATSSTGAADTAAFDTAAKAAADKVAQEAAARAAAQAAQQSAASGAAGATSASQAAGVSSF